MLFNASVKMLAGSVGFLRARPQKAQPVQSLHSCFGSAITSVTLPEHLSSAERGLCRQGSTELSAVSFETLLSP